FRARAFTGTGAKTQPPDPPPPLTEAAARAIVARREARTLETAPAREFDVMGKLADRYPFPAPEGSHWSVPQDFDVVFNWDYADGRETMMGLYRKGVEMQWNAETRIDWTQELDEENPEQLPEEMLPISGMAEYEKMSAKEKAKVRRHFQGWQISQFMQGEQGAL